MDMDTQEFSRNRLVGWTSLAVGVAVGLVMGLWSFDGPLQPPAWMGEYADTSRRLVRLGHIAFIGLGVIDILIERELIRSALASRGRAIASWSTNPNIAILGNKSAWRLSIVSFILRHREAYLHHNFIVALLNDLFGIQSRGGCGCAGPYGHRLLGIDIQTSKEFEREIVRGCEGIKPGWVRVNFNYFLSETQFQFLLDAIHLVANEGWRLLPHYTFDPDTGEWRHRAHSRRHVMSLADVSYRTGKMEYRSRHSTEPEWALPNYLEDAKKIIASTPKK